MNTAPKERSESYLWQRAGTSIGLIGCFTFVRECMVSNRMYFEGQRVNGISQTCDKKATIEWHRIELLSPHLTQFIFGKHACDKPVKYSLLEMFSQAKQIRLSSCNKLPLQLSRWWPELAHARSLECHVLPVPEAIPPRAPMLAMSSPAAWKTKGDSSALG